MFRRVLYLSILVVLFAVGNVSASLIVDDLGIVDGLIAYYPFDDDPGGGTTTADESVTGNDGTIVNATWTASGRFGGAFDFDGSTTYIDIPDHVDMNFANSDFTIASWVKSDGDIGTFQGIYSNYGGVSNNVVTTYLNPPGEPILGIRDGSGTTFHAEYNQSLFSAWHHIAALRQGQEIKLFVDGRLRATTNIAGLGTVDLSGFGAKIGTNARYLNNYFDGLIDEVAIYDRALSVSEIHDISATVIPEPTTICLIGFGLLGIFGIGIRQRRKGK